MAISNNFLPKFEISDDLAKDLRNIEIAKQLSTGWYKGQFDYNLRQAGLITMINNEEYYTNINLLFAQRDFFIKGTQGYYIAEFYRLLGFKDADLIEIQNTANQNSVDGIYQTWRAKKGISSEQFKHNINNLKELLINVDEIKIDYENQRYRASVYTTEASRIYNTKESLYGDSLTWGTIQDTFDITKWTQDGRYITPVDIETKYVSLAYGNAIRFYKAGLDVTSKYNSTIKSAVQSMIMYSGNEFMQRTASTKISETSYTLTPLFGGTPETYISVTGTETFNASIKQTFLDDIDDRHFIRYTAFPISLTRGLITVSEERDRLDGREPLLARATSNFSSGTVYTNTFWTLVGYIETLPESLSFLQQSLINAGDEFLFYDTNNRDNGLYIKVKEFKKLSIEEIGYYIQEYFDIKITQDDGGFFQQFIGGLARIFGTLFDWAYSIYDAIPMLRLELQILTTLVNKIFGSHMSEKDVFRMSAQIAWTVIGIIFSPVTFGVSLLITTAIVLAVAGSEAEEKKTEAEKQAEIEKERKDKLTKDNKRRDEEEQMKKKMNSDSDKKEREDFEMFLRNPLHELDTEKRSLENEFKKQFKLM